MTGTWRFIADLSDPHALASSEVRYIREAWREHLQILSTPALLSSFRDALLTQWSLHTRTLDTLFERGPHIPLHTMVSLGVHALYLAHPGFDPSDVEGAHRLLQQEPLIDVLCDATRPDHVLTKWQIKTYHQALTEGQTTCPGVDSSGRAVGRPLGPGVFKTWPNNPRTATGALHEYCPPEHVEAEMDRLLQFHQDHAAQDVPPEVQSAWFVHRFTQIHPFNDGNGRVARALASLVLLRAGLFPFTLLHRERSAYIAALEQADRDDLRPLVDLLVAIQRRTFLSCVQHLGHALRQAPPATLFATPDMERVRDAGRALSGLAVGYLVSTGRAVMQSGRFPGVQAGMSTERGAIYLHGVMPRKHAQAVDPQTVYPAHFNFDACQALFLDGGRLHELLVEIAGVGDAFVGVLGVWVWLKEAGEQEVSAQHVQLAHEDVFQVNWTEPTASACIRFQEWLPNVLRDMFSRWEQLWSVGHEEWQAPRLLSETSTRLLSSSVGPLKDTPIVVLVDGTDPEASNYGAQLKSAFTEAGWNVTYVESTTPVAGSGVTALLPRVVVGDTALLTKEAEILFRLLQSARIDFIHPTTVAPPTGHPTIVVSSKRKPLTQRRPYVP